jgi:acyl-CoA thioesterase FadM
MLPMAVSVEVTTRWDDADRHAHVNNAAYLALIRAAHDLAVELQLDAGVAPAADLRGLEITHRAPSAPGAVVTVLVEPLDADGQLRRVGYRLSVADVPIAEAIATWQLSGPPIILSLPEIDEADGRPFSFAQVVRTYEVGPGGAARPQAIVQWLEHAVFRASQRAGWSPERMKAADFVPLVIGHQLVLGEPVMEGETVEVTSRLVQLRRVSGIWHHEVRRADGALVAADHTRGAFVDLAGRIHAAPRQLLDDLLRGEPAANDER